MSTDLETTTLLVHELARDTIRECHEHASNVHTVWSMLAGEGVEGADKYGIDAIKSWSQQVSMLFTNTFDGKQEVFKDGDLSLFVRSFIIFGVIFHRTHRPQPAREGDYRLGRNTVLMGRYCGQGLYDTPSRSLCVAQLDGEGHCPEHGEPSLVFALPVPGTWSFHS